MSDLLTVRNLSTQFQTERGIAHAVRFVNFTIQQGETMGIVGESGSGKSVTAKSIMRLVESQNGNITSGEILFEDINIAAKTQKQMQKVRGNAISMIFQDPMTSLNPLLKVGSQISEVLRFHKGMNKAQAKQEAVRIMESLSIPSPEKRYHQYPHEFSGGMLQRLMIAIALACKPRLLIADEPTTALDVTIQAQILSLMQDLQREYGMAILMITHDLGVVAEVCDKVSVMYAGEIVESSDVKDIFERPMHPYTKALMDSRPKLGQREKALRSIEGTPPDLSKEIPGCPFAPRCPFKIEQCLKEKPELKELAPDHLVACFVAETAAQKGEGPLGSLVTS